MNKILAITILIIGIVFISGCGGISDDGLKTTKVGTNHIKIQEKLETPEGVIVKIKILETQYPRVEGVIENPTNMDLQIISSGVLIKRMDKNDLEKKYIWVVARDENGHGIISAGRSSEMFFSYSFDCDIISEMKPFVTWSENDGSIIKMYPPYFDNDPRPKY